jgi:hypothetical protein
VKAFGKYYLDTQAAQKFRPAVKKADEPFLAKPDVFAGKKGPDFGQVVGKGRRGLKGGQASRRLGEVLQEDVPLFWADVFLKKIFLRGVFFMGWPGRPARAFRLRAGRGRRGRRSPLYRQDKGGSGAPAGFRVPRIR